MNARTGSYVAAKIVVLLAPALNGNVSKDDVVKALHGLPRKDFDEFQTIILQSVLKLTDGVPEPIIKGNGEFVDEDLAYDTATVINLTVQSLFFNVGGFFTEAGLKLPAQF